MSKPLEIIVDRGLTGDPIGGASSVLIPQIAGQQNKVWIEQEDVGTLPGARYRINQDGLFTWLDGTTFTAAVPPAPGTSFFIHGLVTTVTGSAPPDYTNGFDTAKIFPAMQGRLGWSQPTLAGMPALTDFNQQATSGRYFEDFHEMCTVNKYYNSQEDPAITDAAFNALLVKKDKATILRCLNGVFNGKQLIETGLVYQRNSNVRQVIIASDTNFCGYQLKIAEGAYAVQINSIALFFDSALTFNIYLFNDLTSEPLQTIQVTTQAQTQVVIPLNWVLNYNGTNKGGVFYLGYFQTDLGAGHAIDEQLNLWKNSKIYGAYPFQAQQVGARDFNRNYPSVVFRTYGMNLEISSWHDYTEKIIQNAHLFDEARGLAMAIAILDVIKNSSRTDTVNRIAKEGAASLEYDLNLAMPTEERPFIAGLRSQLTREFGRLNRNFFPKPKAQSVKIGVPGDAGEYAYDTFDIRNLPPRERFY